MINKFKHWLGEVRAYRAECVRWRDFARLLRVRLSQSKLGWLATPNPIVVEIDTRTLGPNLRLRSHTTDISVLREILHGGSYDPLHADPSAQLVLDLGANIGLSHRWLRRLYPNARFVLVEPEPGNAAVLRHNAQSVDPSAIVVEACVGGHERRVSLADVDGEWGFRMTDSDEGAIPVVTVPGLLATAGKDRVDVLKCDVEGAEAEVFADCGAWIDRVGVISLETHLDVISTDALLALIGPTFQVVDRQENPGLGFDLVTLERSAVPAAA